MGSASSTFDLTLPTGCHAGPCRLLHQCKQRAQCTPTPSRKGAPEETDIGEAGCCFKGSWPGPAAAGVGTVRRADAWQTGMNFLPSTHDITKSKLVQCPMHPQRRGHILPVSVFLACSTVPDTELGLPECLWRRQDAAGGAHAVGQASARILALPSAGFGTLGRRPLLSGCVPLCARRLPIESEALLLTSLLWANGLMLLGLSFPICKMDLMHTLQVYWEDKKYCLGLFLAHNGYIINE